MRSPLLVMLLVLCHLGTRAAAQSTATAPGANARPIELTAEAEDESPEVAISPGKSTALFFDAELAPSKEGVDSLMLDRREDFTLVDSGAATLRLVPSKRLKPGDRLRLQVHFKERAAPSGASFILVMHASHAEQVVEVYRNARPVESYQEEAREARAEAAKCRDTLARMRAESAGPGGLVGFLAAGLLDYRGVVPKDLSESITKAAGNALDVRQVWIYRATDRVAVDLRMTTPVGAPTFTVEGTTLTGKRGVELKVLEVWSPGPIRDDPEAKTRVVVEAEATDAVARGPYTLKFVESGTGRSTIVGNVTFP